MKLRDRLTVFFAALLILVMLPPDAAEMAGPSAPAAIVSTSSSSPGVEKVTPSPAESCPTCQSACSSATAQGGLAPLPPRSDLPGEVLRYGAGLAVATGSGAVTYTGIQLTIPGRGPALKVSLNYYSLHRQGDDGWGYGWSFNRDWRYKLETNGDVTVLLARGVYDFASDGQGGFIAASEGMTLTRQSDTLRLEKSDGERVFFEAPTHKHATRWEDANGRALTFTYDADGGLTAINNDQGRQISLSYLNGRLRTVLDVGSVPEQRLQLDYNQAGDLVTVTDSLNQVTQLAYDAEHRLTQVTDPRGDQTALVYAGDYAAQVTRGGLTTSILLGPAEDAITIREVGEHGATRERILTYDYTGSLASTTYPDGAQTTQNWDDVQHQFSQTDENGHTTVTLLDANSQLSAVRNPLGDTTSFTYDPTLGYMTGMTGPDGNTTLFAYDQAGNLAATVDPLGHRSSYAYNASGDMIEFTNPLSHTTTFDYNPSGLLTTITNPLGVPTLMSYDPAGNLTGITDGSGHTTGFAHDALGRVVATSDALGHTASMAYDANGNLISQSDPDGRITRFAYDSSGHRTGMTDALGGELRQAYDAWGNLTTLTDAAGHATAYTYDARKRRTSETDPLGQTISYRYDAAGNRVGVTTAAGQVISSTFDAVNRLTRVDYPGEDDVYIFYDRAGRATRTGDADAEIGYTYDAAGRATKATYSYDGVGFAPLELAYAYDAAGQRVSAALPGGQAVNYEYDAAGHLTAVTGGNTHYELTYDNGDRLTQLAPATGQPGVRTNYAHDATNRLTALANASPDGATAFDTFDYTYDDAGNMLSAVRNSETTAYTYDALQRLTEVAFPDGGWERYSYDSVGNRLQLATPAGAVSYIYDAADQLLSLTDTRSGTPVAPTFTYDANGNLVSRTREGDATAYTWDAANRLERVTFADDSYISYTYGPDGQRLSRRSRSGNVVYYVYDGLNLVQERDPSGNLLASYVYGGELDRPYSMSRGGQTYYYLYDRLGSVVGLTDGAGVMVAAYDYDAWGNLRAESGTVANHPFRYAGREWDAEAQLYYNRARYYDPSLGRFLSRDPLGPVDGTNRYAYVSNNPVRFTDPLGTSRSGGGEECEEPCKCFNKCFAQVADSGVMGVLSTLEQLLTIPFLFASSLREAIGSAIGSLKDIAGSQVEGSGMDCFDQATNSARLIADGVASAAGAMSNFAPTTIATLSLLCTLTTGVGAPVCVGAVVGTAAGILAIASVKAGALLTAAISCASDCKDKRDKELPKIEITEWLCDEYEITATDNCQLAEDPSGTYGAAGQPQDITARDRVGNKAQATIPACSSGCYDKPECKCGRLEWNQQACGWACIPSSSPSQQCPACSEPVQDPGSCGWSCRSRPKPPAPNCGSDKCGNRLTPVPDAATCGWKCQGKGNNPCKPDDTRSLAGLELPVFNPSSTSRWALANAIVPPAEPSAALLSEPALGLRCSIATATGAAPAPGSRIAILDNGFSISLQDFLAQQGVAADRIPPDFSPDMVGRYPALFIPSGGLSGYAGSELMRRRLGHFVENGGVLVVFAQEYGDEFGLLPGGVGGYGFDEDVNCQGYSAQIVTFAPMLLGQSREVLSLNIDGFFTNWPADAETLLSRLANGMPAMVTYPYGAGRVVATTAYADMAYYQGQGTPEEKILLGDLSRWALAPDLAMDMHDPNALVTVPLTLTNHTAMSMEQLWYDVSDPWGRSALSQTQWLPAPLNPGETTHVTLAVDLSALSRPEKDRYGRWSVDVILSDSSGSITQEMPDAFRFAVTRFVGEEGGHSYLGQPYALSVTSATEEYPKGSPATFTYHIFNHSDQEETFRVSWLMIHHSWRGIPGYRGEESITVPAHSVGSLDSTLERVVDLDRVRATLYVGGGPHVAYAERGFWAVKAKLSQTITSDKGTYGWSDTPVLTITSYALGFSASTTVFLTVWDPDGQLFAGDTRSFILGTAPYAYTVTLPSLQKAGYYRVTTREKFAGENVPGASTSFYLVPWLPVISVAIPDRISAGTPVTLTIFNRGPLIAPEAIVEISQIDPNQTSVWTDQAMLPMLASGEMITRTFMLPDLNPISLGDYVLAYRVLYSSQVVAQGRLVVLPVRLALESEIDKSSYRVQDTLYLTATLHNAGRFDLAPLVTVTAPTLGLTVTQQVAIPAGVTADLPFSATLPAELEAGAYPIDITAIQGATITRSMTFAVLPPKLEARLEPGPYRSGQPITVTLSNVGGVDTTADYSISLVGAEGELTQTYGSVPMPAGGTLPITLSVPSQAATRRNYILQASVQDGQTGDEPAWSWPLGIDGVSAILAVPAERPAYLSGEVITLSGQVSMTSGALVGAPLELQVRKATAAENVQINTNVDIPGASKPSIAADAAGNAYAVWEDSRNLWNGFWNPDIYFAYRPIGGQWGANERVNDDVGGAWQTEPSIAVDAAGNAYAVWMDKRSGSYYDIYGAVRPVGGAWGDNVLVGHLTGHDLWMPSIAVNAAGDAYAVWQAGYYGGDIYFARRPAGGEWGPSARLSDASGSDPSIAVDAAGNAYAVWTNILRVNFAYRPAGGSWGPSVNVRDPDTPNETAHASIAVDAADNAYVVWADDRNDVNGGYPDPDVYFAFRPAGGMWGANVRVNDDFVGGSQMVPSVAVDAVGNAYAAWRDTRNGSFFEVYYAYRPAGGLWGANFRANNWSGPGWSEPSIAAYAVGDAVAVWSDGRNGRNDVFSAILSPAWTRELTVSTGGTWPIHETIGTLAPATGKFYIEARLKNQLGQALAYGVAPFYIYQTGAALSLDTDRTVYRPGDTVQISGRVTNTAPLSATVPLTVSADGQTLLHRTLALAPGETASYSTAVVVTASLTLVATAGTARIEQPVTVATPEVEAWLDAPAVVGRAPFSATLEIANTGAVPVALTVDFAGWATRTAMLAPGDHTLLQATLAITEDTVLTVTLSGDVSLTLDQAITQGEMISLTLGLPAGALWAGPVAVPYSLTNVGLLPSSVPVSMTLDGTAVLTREVTTLPGQALTDEVLLDLSPGVHCLAAAIPAQETGGCITVQDPAAALVRIDEALVPARLIGREPLTVTLTNPGPGPADGTLRAETGFDLAEVPFSLDAGATRVLTTTLASDNSSSSGTYTVTIGAWVNAELHSQVERSLEVPAPALQVSMPDIVLVPGSELTLPMTVHNTGGIGLPFTMTLDLHGLYAADRIGFAGPGETVPISYTIALPADVEARIDAGHYALNGVQTPFTYTIAGYELDMSARLSSLTARAGELVTATISITDTSGFGLPIPLRVQLAGAGEPQTEDITLSGSAQASFVITAPIQSALLSYGLYHPDGRSLLLDTLRLHVEGDLFSLQPDRQRYLAGETARLTALAAVTGTLTWQAFAISQTLTLVPFVPATLSVPLASDLTGGTYRVWYQFTASDGRWVQDEVPIDVIGDRVEIREVNLDRSASGSQEVVTATIRLRNLAALNDVVLSRQLLAAGNTALNDVMLTGRVIAPDDSELISRTTTLDLPYGATWVTLPPMTFDRGQAGSYWFRYELTQGGRDLSSGWQAFDVMGPVVLGVHVPRAYFLDTQPVTASVALLNEGALPARLTVLLDGQVAQEQTIVEGGQQTVLLELGVLPSGEHELTARLADSSGLSSQGTATITVKHLGLEVQMPPPDGLGSWHVLTPTLWLWPDIAESAARYRWDGGAASQAAGNQAEIPADGQHELTAWAELPDGTAGPAETATLWLDREPPSVAANIQPGRPVTVSLSAADGASGVDAIDYWDAGAWRTYATPLTFAAVQTTTLFYRARDRAGNDSGSHEVQVPPADPAYGLALSADTDSQEGAPGTTVAYALVITNTGVAADTFAVQVAGNAWSNRGPLKVGPLGAGRSARFVVAVDIPAEAPSNPSDTSIWTVSSQGSSSQFVGLALTTRAGVRHGRAIEAGRTTRSAAPGGAVTYQVRVTNHGNVADTFNVAVTGNAWPVNALAVIGPLAAGAYGDLDVTVQVPLAAMPGESDTATVSIASQADAAQSADIVLVTGAAVTQQNSAPQAPAATASREGTGVKLAWRHLPANHHYEVWRSASPYFDPDDPDAGASKLEDVYPPGGGGTVTFVDTNPPPEAHYVVRGVNGIGQVSTVSNRVGRFSFDLLPGQ